MNDDTSSTPCENPTSNDLSSWACDTVNDFLYETEEVMTDIFGAITSAICEAYGRSLVGVPEEQAAMAIDYLDHYLKSSVESATGYIDPDYPTAGVPDAEALRAVQEALLAALRGDVA